MIADCDALEAHHLEELASLRAAAESGTSRAQAAEAAASAAEARMVRLEEELRRAEERMAEQVG